MILKVALTIAIAMVLMGFIPSIIATFMLLSKGIRSMGQRRQRRALLNYR